MGDTSELEAHLKRYPNPNIRLIPVKPTRLTNAINWLNRIGLFGPVFYLAFPFWQKQAYERAKALLATEQIDIIHQLNPIGFREPGYLWKLDKPFIWGPIGGATFADPVLLEGLAVRFRLYFHVKNFINHIQLKWSRRVHAAAYKAAVLLFCNNENRTNFQRYLGKSGLLMAENAALSVANENGITQITKREGVLDLIWAGQISPRKNLTFILSALALVKNKSKWVLHIVGDGKRVSALRSLSGRLGIETSIRWHGMKSRQEVLYLMRECDLHLMASIAEGSPTVLWEAIGAGIPTISLDRDGMSEALHNGAGILVTITSYQDTLSAYAEAVDALIEDSEIRVSLREKTLDLACQESWAAKIRRLEQVYDSVYTPSRPLIIPETSTGRGNSLNL